MRTLLSVLIIFLFGVQTSGAGNSRGLERKYERAEELYNGGSYSSALPMYLEIFTADSANLNICYKIGDCYLKTGKSSKQAEYYLRKAVQNTTAAYHPESIKERSAPISAHKLLGDACHLNSKFDEAISSYEKYKAALKAARVHDIATTKELARKIQICNNAKELIAHPAAVKIINLGNKINSVHPDYAPRLTADGSTMIYTSRRPENTGGKTYDGGQYYEDIYIATKKDGEWQPGVNIGSPINTVGNEAAIGISADGQEILIYKDDMGDGNIYSSKLEGDKWTVPQKLNANINSKFWEPSAFISADGNTLYFVSDRPGGYGGTDIYKSKKTPSGDWGRAVNLGPTINTPFDEYTPFIHPDGITLFFSSKGHKTMGGYDIFFSRTLPSDDRIWIQPTNVGYPINTPADDAFYMVSPDKQKAFYSSMMDGGFGEKDNYMITFADVKEAPLNLVKGRVTDTTENAPKNMVITVTDNSTHEIVGVYKPNAKTGKFSYILTPGKSYNIAYEADGMLFYSETRFISEENKFVESDIPVKLPSVGVGSKVVLNNLFFDFDDARLRPSSKTELERVHNFLVKNPNVKVELAGYADSKGNDEYNKKLSKARAQSVVEYLKQKGIQADRMTAVGYGEMKSKDKTVKTALTPKGNDANAGRELDRRVELKIIQVSGN